MKNNSIPIISHTMQISRYGPFRVKVSQGNFKTKNILDFGMLYSTCKCFEEHRWEGRCSWLYLVVSLQDSKHLLTLQQVNFPPQREKSFALQLPSHNLN